MPVTSLYGYSANALAYNPATNAFELSADFDYQVDRIHISISDDDNFLDGDGENYGDNEIGSDHNQTAVVTLPDGTPVASGLIYDESFAEVQLPDGSHIWLERVEIGGQHLGYIATGTLSPGGSYPVTFSDDVVAPNTLTYSELSSVPCFGDGVKITTRHGATDICQMTTNHHVLTHDCGFQPVLWVGRTYVRPQELRHFAHLRPVSIPAHALGPDCPNKHMLCSPDHRIMLSSPSAEFLFGLHQVFVSAKSLADSGLASRVIPANGVTYTHLLLANHQVVQAHNLWSESLFTGAQALQRLSWKKRIAIAQALPGSVTAPQTARPCLTHGESRLALC